MAPTPASPAKLERDLVQAEARLDGESSPGWAAELARHARWLRALIRSRLGEPGGDAVDEVLQDVALAACGPNAPPARPETSGPWLYRVALRQTLLHRRRLGRNRNRVRHYAEHLRATEPAASRKSDPLANALLAEDRDRLRNALRSLPPGDAEILTLKYLEGRSYREIAGILGVSESAIDSRIHRARERLRHALREPDCESAHPKPIPRIPPPEAEARSS